MNRSQLGAARVSILWFVAAIVLFIIALVMAFTAYSQKAAEHLLAQDATKRAADAEAASAADRKELAELSRSVGFYDKAAASAKTSRTAYDAAFQTLKVTFPELGVSVATVEDAIPIVAQAYTARGREVAQLKDSIAQLESEKKTLDSSLREALKEKENQLTNLQRQIEDANQNATQRQSELQAQVTALRSQNSDLDKQVRDQKAATDAESRKYKDEETKWTTRFQSMGEKLKFTKEPTTPDGEILAVSKEVPLGWINIGTKNRVGRGMRFHIVSGRAGATAKKAMAEVTNVEADRAEVRFYDIADRFDPVVPGDQIYNPVFDPHSERNAVLVGRFSVPNEAELKALLKNMGITVQSKLDNSTDYLIVGGEMFVDQDGNALPEPMQPSDMPVYKDAEGLGVQITPIKDLRSYFKF